MNVDVYRQHSYLTDGTPLGSRPAVKVKIIQMLPGTDLFLETAFRYAEGGISNYKNIDTHAGLVSDTEDCKPKSDFTYDTIERAGQGLGISHRFYDNPLDSQGFGFGIPHKTLHIRQDQLPAIIARSYLVLFNSYARKGGPVDLAPLGFDPTHEDLKHITHGK